MRRTRHFALPVKAWQYIGLLIVSLACLTLGLVSRDKEGRAGSLAGPELKHQAPHEVDACPNSYFFTKMPYSILDDDQTRLPPKTSVVEPGTGIASSPPDSPRISRSRSLDRSSEARLQSRRDSRIERRKLAVDREAADLSRLRTRSQESPRRSSDPIRLSRSSDHLDARLTTRFLDRRSRSAERGSAVDRREDRVTLASRISERRERSADRFDARDRRSHSTERRESILDRETSREDRRQVRERRSRSLDRRESNFERVNRNRDREDRRRSLVNRLDRRAEDRRSLARDLRQVRTASEEDRRNTRSVLDEKRNSVAGRDHLDSRSRDFERASSYSRINGQYSRSLDRRISINDLPERKLTTRSANVDERRETNTLNSRERSMDRQTSDSRRGRIDRSLGTIDGRDRLRSATRRASKSDLDRRFTVRSERREESNGRRERMARLDRRLETRSNERRESLARSLEQSKVDNLERRERTDRVSRNRVARSPEAVKRDLNQRETDLSVDRRSERRTLLDSRRSAERQSSNDANRKEIRTERARINDLERRERLNRVNVDRQARESRDRVARMSESDLDRRARDLSSDRRSERRVSVESRSLERRERQEIRNDRSRINNLERREELRRVVLAGRVRTDVSRTPDASKRVLERRVRDLSGDRRLERKATVESRTLERQGRQENGNDRSRINNLERREQPRRVVLAGRVRTDVSRTPEASKRVLERRVRDVSADRRLDQRATLESRTLERQERRERQEIRNDRSRINNLERREESRRVVLAGRVRTDVSRTPEASKRVLERRVRDLSADRRSERKANAETRTLNNPERQEIRNDRSRINNLERREEPRRVVLAGRVKTDVSRTPEASKRVLERRVRDLSADRRLDQRATVESRTLERREHQEIRNDRSRINNLERREESRRMALAGQVRTDVSRTPEAAKRVLERRVRDLSADRRSERRATAETRTLNNPERQEIRNDHSRINNLERQEVSRRMTLAGQVRTDVSRTPEASKRVLERRVRDLSADRRSERRATAESRTLNNPERQEIRSDRTRINNLERREESRRVVLAGRVRTDVSRTPEASKRVLERRVRDLSADRRLERKATVESRTLERQERQEIRNDRSRINNLERREEPRRVVLAGRVRTDASRTPEVSKRVLERRVRDLSADRRSERKATVESRTLERRERQEIRNVRSRINSLERVRDLSADRRLERRTTVASRSLEPQDRREIRSARSRINNFERQDEPRQLTSARRVRTDLSRTPEASIRLLERRVRDLSADRRSERKATVESRTLERRERQEIRNIRSRINSLERVRGLSADRRLERRTTVASRSLEPQERREIRSVRPRINNFERQDEPRRLTLARDLSSTAESSKRDFEVRDSTQRSERRVRSRSSERKLAENDKRRVIRIDGRSERRALLDHARISRSNSANREEIRTDRRLLERSTLTLERSNRLNLARESRSLLTRAPESSNRDLERRAKDLSAERRSDRRALDAGRLIRSSMAVNRQETLDRSLDSGRFLRQKMDVSRLQRSNDHTNDIQRRQRLIATRRLLNDVRQSRLVELSDSRGSRKDLMDSLRQVKSSRDHRISDFDEASSRLKISAVLQRGDSMKNNITLEIVRQAIVIGLCAVYGLSILRGKQSFISNLARHSARLIPW